jgi:UDP-N-acetylglucosamine 2-epimerase (non-hydrolysing)
VHPRTRAKARQFNLALDEHGVRYVDPLGLFEFVNLEQSAFCLLTDSGTVQEEACIFRVPNVTLRDVTERPETIECGSTVLAGCDPGSILRMVKFVTGRSAMWEAPREYLIANVADVVTNIVMAHRAS